MKYKKYIPFLGILFMCMFMLNGGTLQAQDEDAIATYFSKYMERDDFTSIYISSRMIKLIVGNKHSADNPEMENTLRQIGGLRILSADSVDGNKYYEEIFNTLNRQSYEELMSIREPDSDVKFLIKPAGENKVSELLMLVGGDNSFFMLSIIGVNLNLDNVMDIAEDLGPSNDEEEEEKDEEEDKNEQ